jgi:hypothetical protein
MPTKTDPLPINPASNNTGRIIVITPSRRAIYRKMGLAILIIVLAGTTAPIRRP